MKIDKTLVLQAKAGDDSAFASLYETIWQDLYKSAFYILGNRDDAMDVVSETFMEAYRGISKLRDEAAFKSWMYTILNARCKRKIAGYMKERGNISIDDLFGECSVEFDGHSDLRVTLSSALAGLTQEERTIVVLSSVQGYTTREIATILKKPHGTICSKLSRTLKKIRATMEAQGVGYDFAEKGVNTK